jgi:hypothetical protein
MSLKWQDLINISAYKFSAFENGTTAMSLFTTALKDFAEGLTRGLALFATERQDWTARTLERSVSYRR